MRSTLALRSKNGSIVKNVLTDFFIEGKEAIMWGIAGSEAYMGDRRDSVSEPQVPVREAIHVNYGDIDGKVGAKDI